MRFRTAQPFQGYKRATDDPQDLGHVINHNKLYRLKEKMELLTVYPELNLSKRQQEKNIFFILDFCFLIHY